MAIPVLIFMKFT